MGPGLTLSIDPQLFPRFPWLRLGAFMVLRVDRVFAAVGETRLIRVCRTIGLRHYVTLGAYDLDALPEPAITIRAARPQADWFVPLGARPTDVPLADDGVVLAAGKSILTWRRTHSRDTCLCSRTRRAAFVSEAITQGHASAAEDALDELRRLLAGSGGVLGDAVYVDVRTPRAELRCESSPL